MVTLKDTVFINGMMAEFMKVLGTRTRCTEEECTLGKMGESTLVSTSMTRNTVRAGLTGQMEDYTKENGQMVNNMDMVSIPIPKGKNRKDNG